MERHLQGHAQQPPSYDDEFQMRAFWTRWNQRIFRREGMRVATMQTSPARGRGFPFPGGRSARRRRLPERLECSLRTRPTAFPRPTCRRTRLPIGNLFYIADDRFRLGERVGRLMKRAAHFEFPHSRTRHFVSNVRIRQRDEAEISVSAAFLVYRTRTASRILFLEAIATFWCAGEKRCASVKSAVCSIPTASARRAA